MQSPFSRPRLLALLTLLVLRVFAADRPVTAAEILTATTDRADALYQTGDTVTFVIQLESGGKPATTGEIEWTLTKDGVAPTRTGRASLVQDRATVAGKLDEPGFLQCRVTFQSGQTKLAALAGRIAGWPKFIATRETPPPDVAEAVRYYDGVNFAARTRAPGFFTVGFIDTTCPPTSVYAAYNAVRTTKEIFNDITAGHTNTPAASKAMRAAVLGHLAATRRPAASE